MIKKLLMIMAAIIIFHFNIPAFGYDDTKTHPALTAIAIEKSNLDEYLKTSLGISEGKDKIYKQDKTIVDLLKDGSTNEDLEPRAFNHFWDPIHNSGLDDLPRIWGRATLTNCKYLE